MEKEIYCLVCGLPSEGAFDCPNNCKSPFHPESGYIITKNYKLDMSYLLTEISVSPYKLNKFLGGLETSTGGDGYKVSREWIIEKNGTQFTIYDYKSTNLYDSSLWSPEEQWNSKEPFDIHIGGVTGHETLLRELIDLLKDNC